MKLFSMLSITALLAFFAGTVLAGDPPSSWDKNTTRVIMNGSCSGTIVFVRTDHIRFKSNNGIEYKLYYNYDASLNVPLVRQSAIAALKDGDNVTVDWAVYRTLLLTGVKKERSSVPASSVTSKFEEEQRKKKSEITDLFSRGVGLFNNENFDEAIKVFQAVRVIDPNHAGAKDYLDKTADKISEKSAWNHFYKGNELSAAGKIVEAVAEWQLAVSSSPDNKALTDAVLLSKQKILNEHNEKGSNYIKQGKVVEAIAEFNAALGVEPSNEAAKKGMEVANSKFKNLREEEKTGLEYESYYGRAMASIDRKDYLAALDFYEKAAKVRPSKEILNGIATLKEQIKNMHLAALSKAGKFASDGNWVEAARQWRLCITIDPKSKVAAESLEKYSTELKTERDRLYLEGLEAYGSGNTEVAIAKWKEVLVLDPDYQKAQLNILKATRKQ